MMSSNIFIYLCDDDSGVVQSGYAPLAKQNERYITHQHEGLNFFTLGNNHMSLMEWFANDGR